MMVKLSASQVISADDCRRSHWYRSVAKVRTEAASANLVFGTAIDTATRNFLNALALGKQPDPPEQEFAELWNEARRKKAIQYAATKDPKDFLDIGVGLMKALPEGWARTGWTVAIDRDGKPMTDRFLKSDLGTRNGVTVLYRGKIDVGVYTAQASYGVVDVKTAAQPHSPIYTERADQLTGYQVVHDENAEALGLPQVEALGFFDLLKRKKPQIESVEVGRRTPEAIEEFRQKLFWLADDVKRKRFPRASRHAYNSPCQLCDFARHCVYGETEGLVFPSGNGAAPCGP